MFNQKVLLIVGAGAGVDANMPTGTQLCKTIARLIKKDDVINRAIENIAHQANPAEDIELYKSARRDIEGAMFQAKSIDDFLEYHQDEKQIKFCGKLAIVRSILEAERNSLFRSKHGTLGGIAFPTLKDTWYGSFWHLLIDGISPNNLQDIFHNLSMIVFNYDRCIEHFLYYSLQNYFLVQEDEAAALLKSLELFHPYGVVGKLPWEDRSDYIPFGCEAKPNELINLTDQIKTLHEREEDQTTQIMRQKVAEAEVIIFLGFAFHWQNIKLITQDLRQTSKLIYSTAKGFSESECQAIVRKKMRAFSSKQADNHNVKIHSGMECHELFDEYGETLSAI